MRRLRIMHVVDSFGTGGTEEGIRKLLAGLDPAAFEQIVCTVAPAPESETKAAQRVISVGRAGGGRQVLAGKLKRLFDKERPHIVHSRNWGAIEAVPAARMAGVPAVIHSEHGLELATYQRQPWRRNVIRKFCFRWADRVFAVSNALRTYYAQQLRIEESRIAVIRNGVDTERFRHREELRIAWRQKLGVGSETVVIGTVGRLDPIKDHKTLFTAVDRLLAMNLPVYLVIVGDGPERKALEQDIRARNVLAGRSIFAGATNEIVAHLNSFDAFVLPSLAEGMSNALLEAMSAGLACVATRAGGNPELLEEGSSGLLFEAGDAVGLAASLKALAFDPQRRRDLGVNARRRAVEVFSLECMLSNYVQLYEEALSNRSAETAVLNYVPSVRTGHE